MIPTIDIGNSNGAKSVSIYYVIFDYTIPSL